MKFSLFIFLSFFSLSLSAQEVVSIQNGQNYDPEMVLPFLRPLYSQNDLVLAFRVRLTDKQDEKSDYFILTRKEDQLSAYQYINKADKLQPLNLSTESNDLIWKTFVQNQLFSMRDEKDIANFCAKKYDIYNSYTYEFVILSKEKMKKLSYYSPEYYDEACFGMAERKMIINSVSIINYVLAK